MTNILEYLETTARRVPGKIALSGEGGALSFAELRAQARNMGSLLLDRGITKTAVAVLMPKEAATVAAFLGAVYAGCWYVPLDGEMPRHRIELILRQVNPGALIFDGSTEALARELGVTCPMIAYAQGADFPENPGALDRVRREQLDIDPIYIVFTSGSTGIPKGVVGCHRAVIDYIEALCPVLKFDEGTVFGNQSPLYFDAWLKEIIPTLKFGGTTYLIPRRLFLTPVRLVEYLNAHKINTLCWVVSALTTVSSLGTFEQVKPEHVRTVAFASEVFPIRQLKLWRAALPRARFVNLYGPTETTGICCYYEVDREFPEEEVLPIGQCFPNTQILLLDEENRPANRGEICIRGTRLTLGYYGDPERTAAAFVQNPLQSLFPETIYRTGDLGYYNDRGELMFLGRRDHQIKHMGHRIELGEIEAAAAALPGIDGVCCVYSGEKIRLYYTGDQPKGALVAWLRQRLPRYMLPQAVQWLEQLPRTPNGKPDRNLLKQRSEQHG